MAESTRDALANAMCRHSATADWFEKADEILTDLERDGIRLLRIGSMDDPDAPWAPRPEVRDVGS